MPEAGRVTAYVGLGANLGDALATLRDALRRLGELPGSRLVRRSSIYRTAPIESSGPDYLNAVAEISTGLAPLDLLGRMQAIEQVNGRERPYRNAPRTLDLDLLLYGDTVLSSEALTVPHPRMHLRAFVLQPLVELVPSLSIPGRGDALACLAAVADQRIDRLAP